MSPKFQPLAHASALALGASLALSACQAGPPEPSPDKPAAAQQGAQPAKTAEAPKLPTYYHHPIGGGRLKKPLATVQPSPDDPLKGEFTLEDATKGLPEGKDLVATIETSVGKMECKLLADKAPISVANFIGLARGVRPWKTPDGKWEKKPAYDGTTFHRIVKGFMIQGGDPKGNGSGEPGYVIPDELWEGGKHDKAGLLCMANRGPNTNGAQFFITDAAAPHLDSGYTIFGECGPEEVIHKIASLPVRGERPETLPEIKKVTISRK